MTVPSCETPAFRGLGLDHLLSEVSRVLEAQTGLPVGSLVVPRYFSDGEFDPRLSKSFCVGLLENPDTHPWSPAMAGLSLSSRVTISGSVFLFRKCLPSPGDSQFRSHRSKICTEPRQLDLPTSYLSHCRKIARECFPPGWDKGYWSAVSSSSPSISSCLESSRRHGGARSLGRSRLDFGRACVEGEFEPVSRDARFVEVVCDGKRRGVTVHSADTGILRPLHKLIYDQLSRQSWLLRGEAKPSSFDGFSKEPGEVFVSGDYESATDNLPLEVAETLLVAMEQTSCRVPDSIWRTARSCLRSRIFYEDSSVPFEQTAGQMMGSLLSFPLLCLQNYCAFRWCHDTSVPVKINGDDIVFRSSRGDYEKWSRFVSRVGLVLSSGKTLVSPGFFSLNSAFFRPRRRKLPRRIPVLRCGSLTRPVETLGSLRGSYFSFARGFGGSCDGVFLSCKKAAILASGRPVRALGIPCSEESLRRSGLWKREKWYYDLPGRVYPLPQDPSDLRWRPLPVGWRREVIVGRSARRKALRSERDFWELVVDGSWEDCPTRGTTLQSYWSEVKSSGSEGDWKSLRNRRFVTRFGMKIPIRKPTPRGARTAFCRLKNSLRVEKVWVRESDPGGSCGDLPTVDIDLLDPCVILGVNPKYDQGEDRWDGEMVWAPLTYS